MMNTSNRTIMDSTIKEDFNENHKGLQGEKQPLEPKRSRIQEQGLILLSTRIGPYKKKEYWREYSFKDRSFQDKD